MMSPLSRIQLERLVGRFQSRGLLGLRQWPDARFVARDGSSGAAGVLATADDVIE
jgi:hypothetical protein